METVNNDSMTPRKIENDVREDCREHNLPPKYTKENWSYKSYLQGNGRDLRGLRKKYKFVDGSNNMSPNNKNRTIGTRTHRKKNQ